MKSIVDLNLGFGDAENYKQKENKELFNEIFVRNKYLDELLMPSKYFLIGEKGTGKTAYSVYLSNNNYKETIAQIKYLRETDYQKFLTLKRDKQLQLSDYAGIWKVIILLLLAKSLRKQELDGVFGKDAKMKSLLSAIDEYYKHAFSPEIITVLDFIEHDKSAAGVVAKASQSKIKFTSERSNQIETHENRFQIHLLYIQRQFEQAFSELKLKENHLLFIDGLDIRPGLIPFREYLECVKGLADAIWSLNSDFFANIKDSKGRFRAVCLIRPDIYNSLALQNATNKLRDNSVYLDWRTNYNDYRESQIFLLTDKLLASQQSEKFEFGAVWDHYFPFVFPSNDPNKENDPAFVEFLRMTYSRPRDIISILQILQDKIKSESSRNICQFTRSDYMSSYFQNGYSEYLMSSIKDQLAFYSSEEDYELFLHFFSYLKGRIDFTYDEYLKAYGQYAEYIYNNLRDNMPEFIETADKFLQFIYESNIICYIEDTDRGPLFRWCYRERSMSNMNPKVLIQSRYRIHYGLAKALNVGNLKVK